MVQLKGGGGADPKSEKFRDPNPVLIKLGSGKSEPTDVIRIRVESESVCSRVSDSNPIILTRSPRVADPD